MGKFDGHFVMESQENLGPSMLATGVTEELCKKMLDPKNMISVKILENSDGSLTTMTEHSIATEFNSTTTIKIGERTEIKKPFSYFVTVTKKNENTYENRIEMAGKVMVVESVVHNYGMSSRGIVEGTAMSFREEFKRVSPKVTGFYVFESETRMGPVVKMLAPQMDLADWDKMKYSMALGVIEKSDGLCLDERFGGPKNVYTFKFDEEIDYCQPDFNVDDKRITTIIGPGCYKTVAKPKKDGKVWEYTSTFNDFGASFITKMGGLEGTEFYKRVPDVEGTWRMVSQTGMENYLEALGITGTQKTEMIAKTASEYFTMERMTPCKIRTLSNSSWLPSEVVGKIGEPFTMDMPGFGSVECITTELKDTMLNVMKFQGKTISITEKFTGEFMVAEYVVDGSKASTMKAIFARD